MDTGKKTPKSIRILSASVDAALTAVVPLLLQSHGFEVITSQSLLHAYAEIQAQPFNVLIFGSQLPTDTCWQLAEVFR